MEKHFVSLTHKNNYLNLIIEDEMYPSDIERASLFYIISGNNDLYRKRSFIYNAREHCIKICLSNNEVDFSSGLRSLIKLGFNLYNGWSDEYTSPIDLIGNLDEQNKKIAGNAMLIRFNRNFFDKLLE